MRNCSKLLLISISSFFLYVAPVWATTRTVGPSDCSASAVNSAIAASSDGDTVLLTCTGTVTWTASISIPSSKGVTLNGGGTNTPKGSASFPLTIVSSQSPAVGIVAGPNKEVSRITGFKFRNTGTAGDVGFINVGGQGVGKTGIGAFRIDNNYLDSISGNAIITVFSNGGPLYGLIDNNTMHDAYTATNVDYGPYGIQIWNDFRTDGCWGKNGWIDPFNFGSNNFVFIENNLFENVTSGKYMRHYISAELGGRYVARYNEFNVTVKSPGGNNTDLIEAHGYCLANSNGAGARGGEVYQNTFSGNQIGRPILARGGNWLIFDNHFNSVGTWASAINFLEYRAGDSSMYGQCSSTSPCTSPWYPHVTDNPLRYPLDEQVTGTYVWNNLYNKVNQSPAVDNRGYQALYIQSGRDYFVSTSKPVALSSYAAYAYPHPLAQTSPQQQKGPASVLINAIDKFVNGSYWTQYTGKIYTYVLQPNKYKGKTISNVAQDGVALIKQGSVDLCESTKGSYFMDSSDGSLYVHGNDDADPDTHIIEVVYH